jgi:Domain of unknown function (DUF4432)
MKMRIRTMALGIACLALIIVIAEANHMIQVSSSTAARAGSGGQGLYVRYGHRVMPRYIEWRMMGEGQYAVGTEPCTNTFGREEVRRLGEQIMLQPGDKRIYETEVGILDGAEQIAQFRGEIQRVLANRAESSVEKRAGSAD